MGERFETFPWESNGLGTAQDLGRNIDAESASIFLPYVSIAGIGFIIKNQCQHQYFCLSLAPYPDHWTPTGRSRSAHPCIVRSDSDSMGSTVEREI
jgi:hypothetical protein